MSLTKKIGQNFIWRGLYLASMLLSNILFARVLGAEQSGSFYFIVNNISLLILLAGFCLETSIIYFGSSRQIAFGTLLIAGLAWAILAGIAGAFFGAIAISSYSLHYNGWIWGLFTMAFVLINYCSALFNAQEDFKTYNLVLTAINAVFIIGLLGLMIFPETAKRFLSNYELNLLELVTHSYLWTVIVQGIFVGMIWLIKNRHVSFKWPSIEEWSQLIRYASVSLMANIVFFLVYRVDYWFINYYQASGTPLGNYIQVSKLGQLFIMIPSMIATVIFPTAALASQPSIRIELIRLCRIFFSVYLFLLALLSIAGYWLFPFIFGESFSQMYGAFAALSPGIAALAVQSLLAAWFAGHDKVKYNVYGALIALAIIILFNIILIPRMGILGAATASSIGYISYCMYSIYKFRLEEGKSGFYGVLINKNDVGWLLKLLRK